MAYIVATLIGFTIVISMVQNARLTKDISNNQTTLMNFMTGLTSITVIFLLSGAGMGAFKGFTTLPPLAYIGGIIGVAVVFISTVVIQKVSIIAASMLMYTGQMLAGIIIDYYRGIELSPLKFIGCGLIIAGIYFNAYVASKATSEEQLYVPD